CAKESPVSATENYYGLDSW
nr:immunoglobulin heavy chain junction region [Macaca mulatta]